MARLTYTGAQLDAAIRKVRSDFADVSVVDAESKDVKTGKKFINALKQEIIGSMPESVISSGVMITAETISDTISDYPIEIKPTATIDKSGFVESIPEGNTITKYIKTQTKICTPTDTIQEIVPSIGRLLSKVTVRAASSSGPGEITGYSATFSKDVGTSPNVKFIYLNGTVATISANGVYSNVVYICVLEHYSYGGTPTVTGATLSDFTNGFWLKNNVEFHTWGTWGICLTGDTMISLSDGSVKRIDKLQLRDEYLSYNLDTGALVKDSGYRLDNLFTRLIPYEKIADRYNKCTFDDGTIINEVHGHRFFNVTKKEFIYLMFWEIGDRIYKIDGTTPKLISKETIFETTKHYSVSTKKHHNGFANGCLYGDKHTQKYEINMMNDKPIQNQTKPTTVSMYWRRKKLSEDKTKSWKEIKYEIK